MDPLTGATSFAAIISLLADFTNQRQHRSDQDYDDFMSWLTENRHSEIVTLLQQNFATVVSVKALLSQDRDELRRRLDHRWCAIRLVRGSAPGVRFHNLSVAGQAEVKSRTIS